MWFDLRCIRIPTEPKSFYKFLGISLPIYIWVSGKVCVVVANRAIELA